VVQNHPQVSSAALSPDGRYLATGTWRGTGVKVAEVATGRLVVDLPTPESAGVAFTRDGTQLLILEGDGSYRAHRVSTWEQEWQRQEPDTGFGRSMRAALHPDGRIMAHVRDRENLRLVDLATGEELAVLAVPESQTLSNYQFSPDGRYLAAVTSRGAVQLWDLWRLRNRLRDLGLDWDHPPLGEAEDSAAAGSVRFRAQGG
jgi:WD40 repeat protein